jgi:DnaD/phage-associated family protein
LTLTERIYFMTSMPWFRVYGDMRRDRKLMRVCKKTGQTPALVIGIWVCMLAGASDSPRRGFLLLSEEIPFTVDDLEEETGLPREVLGPILDEFRILSMIAGDEVIQIVNWSKRQPKSDNVSERVRRHREKRSSNVTPKRYNAVIEAEEESESEEESEAEEEAGGAASSNVFRIYEQEIGPLTPLIRDALILAEEDHTAQWVMAAIREASANNGRSWKYIEAILRRWSKEGYGSDRRKDQKKNGEPGIFQALRDYQEDQLNGKQ